MPLLADFPLFGDVALLRILLAEVFCAVDERVRFAVLERYAAPGTGR
ncbi:MAG: hypothetical protein JRE20_06385 [Deltaproteobacteria bacterium]|nr:hypothetical protein [Deltaproteobacteria bacterium]